jgi:hypothetical protein
MARNSIRDRLASVTRLQKEATDARIERDKARKERDERVAAQQSALRHIVHMAPATQQLLRSDSLTTAALGSDGESLVWELDNHLVLDLSPFGDTWRMRDLQGRLTDVSFKFGPEGDVTTRSVLTMVGFADLAGRTDETLTPQAFAQMMSGTLDAAS